MNVVVPEPGSPDWDDFVRRVAEVRYPKMFTSQLPPNELKSVLDLADKWARALVEAMRP